MMKEKEKIVFLLHVSPPVHGSSVVGKAIKESDKINSEFECFYINLLASKDVSNTGIINFQKIIGFIINWFRLMRVLIIERPTVCYLAMTTTGAAFFRDVLLIAWVRLFGLKRIYHLHNKGIVTKKDNPFYRFCYKFIFKNAKVILLAKSLCADIEDYVDVTNLYICPNGVADACVEKKKIDQTISPVQILFLSNLIKSKGVNVLIDACSILQQKGLNFECTFIGGEGDVTVSQFNARVDELGLTNTVRYIGKKFGKNKTEAFSKADIFAFPTYYSNECFPLVLLEAMSFSLPLVSTFEGGIPDIVENGVSGFLVTQRDVDALAERLEELILNPAKRLVFGSVGRQKFENEFTLNLFEKKLVDILKISAYDN